MRAEKPWAPRYRSRVSYDDDFLEISEKFTAAEVIEIENRDTCDFVDRNALAKMNWQLMSETWRKFREPGMRIVLVP